MQRMLRFAGMGLSAASFATPAAAQFEFVGSLDFPTSTRSEEAQQRFLRGVAILHSFGWKQATEPFQAAQGLDPDFALADLPPMVEPVLLRELDSFLSSQASPA